MKYKVEITETLQRTIEVEAEDESEAITKVKKLYYNYDVILDDRDFIDAEFDIYPRFH